MPETRTYKYNSQLRIETRDGAIVISGLAVPYNRPTLLYEDENEVVLEVVRPGVFDASLLEGRSVISTFNHNVDYLLGAWSATNNPGTLRLIETAQGLRTEIRPPDTATLRDLLFVPLKRRDIKGQSFMFEPYPDGVRVTARKGKDGRTINQRELLSVKLYEVGPVSLPAYSTTTAELSAGRS